MLPDLLSRHLNLIVCNTEAEARSADVPPYYAEPGNRFWQTLADVGLTSEELLPNQYERLLTFGIGLTTWPAQKLGTNRASVASMVDIILLRTKLMSYQPWYFCFNGKLAAQLFLCRPHVDFGVQPERYGRAVVFVAPSTRAAANEPWDLAVWQDLAKRVLRPRATRSQPRRG
jgi:TDG/mug DNA glycosylase family protein